MITSLGPWSLGGRIRPPPLLFFLLLSGCGTLVGTSSSPSPEPLPSPKAPSSKPSVPDPRRPDVDTGPVIVAEPSPGPLDPILDSPWAGAEGLEEEVLYWVESFQTREADRFRASLVRMGRYRRMVEEELAARRLPASLAYLPIVESWYDPTAVSWVGAAGLWQFMAPTARGMGLRVNRVVDERRDPFRATPLAMEFLARLNGRFGSWFLALAAYNGGPGRLARILDREEPGWEGHDGLFLAVRDHLPRETRNFVPRFLAAATIARNPEAFGFGGVIPEATLLFDEVEVPDATTLDVVAMAAGVDEEVVGILNPQLLRGFTPAGQRTVVKVPRGAGGSFAEAYARIPPSERATFLEHVVASGETLTHIARDYGVPLDDLRAANPRIEPRRMQIGQRVVVPTGGSARRALATREGAPATLEEELLIYTVRPGDTLTAIAARHRVRVGDLLRWNELSMEAIIRPGDEVKIYLSGGGG